MTNDVKVPDNIRSTSPVTVSRPNSVPAQYRLANEARIGKFMDEVIAAAKDDRMNTKRAISADIASATRVQNQNERVIAACERELRRKDLPEESKEQILRCMSRAAESTSDISKASREFQREQLSHSHKILWKLIGIGAAIVIGGVGGRALVRAVA